MSNEDQREKARKNCMELLVRADSFFVICSLDKGDHAEVIAAGSHRPKDGIGLIRSLRDLENSILKGESV